MNVHGHTVTNEQIDEIWRNVGLRAEFTSGEVIGIAERAGVHRIAAYRAADRLLQRWRKQGRIAFENGKWHHTIDGNR